MRKGELTKQEILEATLRVIVSDGVHNTTFRAVAQEADLNLSLVGYHFPDRASLLRSAIAMLFARESILIDRIFMDVFSQLQRYTKRDFAKATSRAEIALVLTDTITDVITNYYLSEKTDPRALLILKFDPHPDPALRHVRSLGLRSLKAYLIDLCKYLQSENPREHARLLASVFVLFELETLKSNRPSNARIHKAVWQIMCLILQINCSIDEATARVRKRQHRSFDNLLAQRDLFN